MRELEDEMIRRRLAGVYARLPRIACKGLCQECCGPVPATDGEVRLMERAAWPRQHGFDLAKGNCTFLNVNTGKCTCYEDRPLICRLWGSVPDLACPFGCQPDRWADIYDIVELMAAVDRAGGAPAIPPARVGNRLATKAEMDAISAQAEGVIAMGFRYPEDWDADRPYLVCTHCGWRGQAVPDVDQDSLIGLACPRHGDGVLRLAVEGDKPLFTLPKGSVLSELLPRHRKKG